MSDFSVRVFDHNWGRVLLPAGVTFAPQYWDASAIGGPSSAEIKVTGDLLRLVELSNWAGYTIWIMSPDNEYVWWGDIEEVLFAHAGTTVGITLSGIANRIKVLYTDDSPGGDADTAETTWTQDSASITMYGPRERQHTARSPMREAQAEQMRDTLLGRVSRPVAVVGQIVPESEESQAILHCTGFWDRLGRIYYQDTDGLVEHTDGGTPWPLGLGFTSDFVAALSNDGRYRFGQMYGRFKHFGEYRNLRITFSGSNLNDNLYTVLSGDAKEPVSYNANTIKFIAADDIEDSAGGLEPFAADDLLQITGSASNSGTHRVKTPGRTAMEISPTYIGHNLEHENAGPSINILRGNSIMVEQAIVNESTGETITVTAHGAQIAQGFYTASAGDWVAARVEIKLRKVGTPTHNVQVRLYSDYLTAPGTWLATATIAAADISAAEGGRWVATDFDVPIMLDNSLPYWLVVLRDGANDSANYYEVYVDDSGSYPNGGVLLHTGAGFVSPLEPLSLLFRLQGAVDTALQAQAMCATSDVFAAVQVADLSGLVTGQYRDGSLYTADEIRELLDTGDGTNTRLIATVNPQRWALIRKQPARATAQYLWRDGALYTLQGKPVSPGLLPVGEWCHIDNPLMLQGALATASPFFIESATYTPDSGWQLRAAGEPDPWAIGETLDG